MQASIYQLTFQRDLPSSRPASRRLAGDKIRPGMRMPGLLALLLLSASLAGAQPKRVLYVTHSAGYRHDCLPVSAAVLQQIAADSGQLEVVATEDVALLSADGLRDFDAVFFFTSGELPITDSQRQDLLDFV